MPAKENKRNHVERIGHLVSLLERFMRRELAEALIPLNITLPQYAALMILSNEDNISNAKLAKRSFMTPQSANEMVGSLEAKQFVKREPDASHRRILHILITPKGKNILRKADAAVLRIEQRMLAHISANERLKFRDQLIGCIHALGDVEPLSLTENPKID